MTIRTAEELVDAHQQVQAAKSPKEKDAAAGRLVSAELAHFKKLGLEREPQNFVQRVVLPVALVLVLAVTLVLVLLFSVEANQTANTVSDLQAAGIVSQRETCERQNEARVNSVKEKRALLATLETQYRLWSLVAALTDEQQASQTPPEIAKAFAVFIQKLHDGVESERAAITGLIAPYAEVAIRPGSPIVDCTLAVPSSG